MMDTAAIRKRHTIAVRTCEADWRTLLEEFDVVNAENERLRTAMRDAMLNLPGNGTEETAYGILFDALGLDGAPQDGGVTDPHETSGPPTVRLDPGEERRMLGLLNGWTRMHSMTVTRDTLNRIDAGEPIEALLDYECARLLAHECGWQTRRRLENAQPAHYTSRPAAGTRVILPMPGDLSTTGTVEPDTEQPANLQRVRVRWDDGHSTTIRCEQLRPEATA